MKRLLVFTTIALAWACALLIESSTPTAAQEQDERMYIFGTRLVLISPNQLVGPPSYGWWGDKLPMEYTHATGTIIKTVNEARAERGEQRRVDYKSYPIVIGGEMQRNGMWEYSIDFQQMYPADIEVVMAKFPLEGVLSDLQTEIRPVSTGYYYGSSQDGSAVNIALPGAELTFSSEQSFEQSKAAVAEALNNYFGRNLAFDLGISRYYSASGYDNFDVTITVYMDDSYKDGGYPIQYGE